MRRVAALDPNSAPIDERTVADGLVFASKFARLINFYNPHDRLQGDWREFFDAQPLVQYALLAVTDVATLGEEYRNVLAQLGPDGAARPLTTEHEVTRPVALASLLAILRRANDAHRFFATRPEEKVFMAEVDAAIRQVYAAVLRQGANTLAVWENQKPLLFGKRAWEEAMLDFAPAVWSVGSLRPRDVAPEPGEARMHEALMAAHRADKALVASAQGCLAALLARPQGLAPHFALYLNFLNQHQFAQQRLNRVTGRHLDFYYEKILDESPLPAVYDAIYFAVQSDPKLGPFTLPASARLTGKDAAGQAMVYQTDAALELSGIALAQIATLFVGRPPSVAEPEQHPAITHFYLGTVTQPATVKPPLSAVAAWAPFGEEPAGLPGGPAGPVTVAPAMLGFAIASPYLHLEEGTREIKLSIVWRLAGQSGGMARTLQLVPSTCQLSYSGPAGWVAVEPAAIDVLAQLETGLTLTFRVKLGPGDPACVNFDATHKLDGPFAPDWPVLRVQFPNPLAAFTSADSGVDILLQETMATGAMESIGLNVKAYGMTDLVLYSDAGRIAPSGAMLPFGAQPRVGSSFLVGKAEVFRKKFTDVVLELLWANLPDATQYPNGWRSYYAGYVNTPVWPGPAPLDELFGNSAYQVTLDYLRGGVWEPWPRLIVPAAYDAAREPRYYLFETIPSSGSVPDQLGPGIFYRTPANPGDALNALTLYGTCELPFTPETPGVAVTPSPGTLWEDPAGLPILNQPSYKLAPLLAYSPQSATGFFRVQFAAPAYGFGQEMYPQAASAVAMMNARHLIKEASTAERHAQAEAQAIRKKMAASQAQVQADVATIEKEVQAVLAKLNQPNPGAKAPGVVTRIKTLFSRGRKPAPTPALKTATTPPPPSTVSSGWIPMPMPNPPIAPALRQVTLAYRAQTEILFNKDDEPYGLYHLSPLASYRVAPPSPGAAAGAPTLIESYTQGGYLYAGLSTASLPRNITLLAIVDEAPVAQMAAAHESPVWSFLTSAGWLAAPSPPVDGTYGFQKSGLIHLALPPEMSTSTGLMPSGLFWVRAQVSTPGAARVMRLVPQAGSATWVPTANAPAAAINAHLNTPLPPASLKAFVPAHAGILAVEQWLPSFGGRPAESGRQMQVRLSERLRHKDRAWTPWDYERLLLQEFPAIFYALCLPATGFQKNDPEPQRAPGQVLVLVLPTLPAPPQRLPPGLHAGELLQMTQWLQPRMSAGVQVEVVNPVYLYLHVTAKVTFATDQPTAVYAQLLNAEIKVFLSPWIYQQGALAGAPKQEFNHAAVHDFVAGRAYVKTLSGVIIVLRPGAGSGNDEVVVAGKTGALLRPPKPWNFLITAEQHRIIAV